MMSEETQKNVFGEPLELCSNDPKIKMIKEHIQFVLG